MEIFKRIFENIEKIEIKALGGRKIILSLGACIYDGISAMIPFTAGQMQKADFYEVMDQLLFVFYKTKSERIVSNTCRRSDIGAGFLPYGDDIP